MDETERVYEGVSKQVLRTLKDLIDETLAAEGVRRKFWRECVLASLSAGSDAKEAIEFANVAATSNVYEDANFRNISYNEALRNLQLGLHAGIQQVDSYLSTIEESE